MASNRLNLQIGGGNPEEYEKRKVMREVARAQHQVEDIADIFIDNLIEEVEKSCPPGHYFCFDDQKCKKIPSGHKVKDNGELVKEEVVYREPVSNVDVLSNYISKTVKEEVKPYNPRSARETVSLEERIQLLEKDVFTQMAQSTPNTLVSGIGASLDSGGGAVWLWDLDDVEIGVPYTDPTTGGTKYPSIANGSLLKYNATLTRWEAGPADDQTVEVTTAQVDLTNPQGDPDLINQADDIPGYSAMGTLLTQLDWNKKTYDFFTESTPLTGAIISADASVNAGNTTGILTIQSTGTTDGRIVLNNSSGEEKITLNGHLGQGIFAASCNAAAFTASSATATSVLTKVNFTGLTEFQEDSSVRGGKELTVNRGNTGTTNGGLIVKGISSSSAGQGTPTISEILNVSYGTATTSSSGTADTINYSGGTDSNFSLQNKVSVQALIDAGGGGVGFSFQGNCNVTIARTSGSQPITIEEQEGYFYINNTAGTANSSWTGIAGSAISANQLIIWSESNSRWFAGAVEDDTSFLKIDGTNEMVAKLKIALPSGDSNSAFSIKATGGSESFIVYSGGSVTADGTITVGGNVVPATNGAGNLGSSANHFAQVNATIGNFDHITTDNQSTMANITPTVNGTKFLGGASKRWNAYINDLHVTGVADTLLPKSGQNIDIGTASQPFDDLYVNKVTTTGTNFSVFEGGIQSKETIYAYNAGDSSSSAVLVIKDPNNQHIGTGVGWFSSGNIQSGRISQVTSLNTDNEFYKILLKDTTNSTSSTTGAVRIRGGLGVALNLNVGGAMGVTGNINTDGNLNCATLSESNADTWISATTSDFSGFQNSWISYRVVNNTMALVGMHFANGGVKVLGGGATFNVPTTWSSNVNPFAFQIITKEGNTYDANYKFNSSANSYQWSFPAVEGGNGSQDVWAYITVPFINKQP